MRHYWVVGATMDDRDHYESFVRRGHWFMRNETPAETDKRRQMSSGDRIAIKRMIGQGEPDIEIRALGIIIESDLEEGRIYVQWVQPTLQRRVPSRGCYATIHGPFAGDDEWTRQVFEL